VSTSAVTYQPLAHPNISITSNAVIISVNQRFQLTNQLLELILSNGTLAAHGGGLGTRPDRFNIRHRSFRTAPLPVRFRRNDISTRRARVGDGGFGHRESTPFLRRGVVYSHRESSLFVFHVTRCNRKKNDTKNYQM